MRIGRIETIRIVLGPSVAQEKTFSPKLIPACYRRAKLCAGGSAGFHDARQAGQDKCRVKIVGPRLIIIRAVSPRTVLPLAPHDITGRTFRPLAKARLTAQLADNRQSFAGQQTRIEHARVVQRRVTKTACVRRFLCAIQILETEITDRSPKAQQFPPPTQPSTPPTSA